MSEQLQRALQEVKAIQKEVARLGANRKAALSVHVTKEVIADVEQRLERLAASLEAGAGASGDLPGQG